MTPSSHDSTLIKCWVMSGMRARHGDLNEGVARRAAFGPPCVVEVVGNPLKVSGPRLGALGTWADPVL